MGKAEPQMNGLRAVIANTSALHGIYVPVREDFDSDETYCASLDEAVSPAWRVQQRSVEQ